ncbi:MAG TPA: SUMF1/EgtB/PvdO family nonheme iron enzyme [Labilithrix sp.]|nr:SUMF1/EgtB/PvdO family nonheme iron enzyme [Labilithrix sp.]
MLRLRRAAPLVIGLVLAAACGTPDEGGSSSSGKIPAAANDGGVVLLPDGGTARGKGRSCTGGPGADAKCGGQPNDDQAAGGTDCCDVKAVPGGTYNRFNDAAFPATVSPFSLDTFEVTVGRFRAWVDATKGNLRASAPPEGGGAHPKIAGSGWRTEWNKYLPSSLKEVDRMLGPEDTDEPFMACQFGTNIDDSGALTWWTDTLDKRIKDRNKGNAKVLAENTKEALDRKPLNCVPWHVLFAFCVWDGGRLPTDAEFGFALAGGDEQRPYPWGKVDAKDLAHIADRNDLSLVPTYEYGSKYATARLYDKTLGPNLFEDNYSFTYGGKTMGKSDNATHIAPVGRKPLGNGKWGHADLAGGMFEWMLDEGPIPQGQCKDCANVNWPKGEAKDPQAYTDQPEFKNPGGIDWWKGGARSIRGSAWDNANGFATTQSKSEIEYYTSYPVLRTYRALGGRCARDL